MSNPDTRREDLEAQRAAALWEAEVQRTRARRMRTLAQDLAALADPDLVADYLEQATQADARAAQADARHRRLQADLTSR